MKHTPPSSKHKSPARPTPRRPSRAIVGPKTETTKDSDPNRLIGAQRQLNTQVKTARGRSNSSARWLGRQLNDPFVAEAKRLGYRSRAAFKLIGIDDQFHILRPGARVLDLGCAPGGWLQVARERCGDDAAIFGIDLQAVEPVPGCHILRGDIRDQGIQRQVIALAGGKLHVVMSDMADASTGHAATDHLRVMALIDIAFDVADHLLLPGGSFVAKVLQGGAQGDTLQQLKQAFTKVKTFKPAASRSDSREQFIVALGFRGTD